VPVDVKLDELVRQLPETGRIGVVAHQADRALAMKLRKSLAGPSRTAAVLTILDEVNSRGCQDVGLLPNWLPGYVPADAPGLGGRQILEAAAKGELRALVVVGPGPGGDDEDLFQAALAKVEAAVVVTPFIGTASRLATVLLPGRTLVEKAGTVTNTEGRVQRVRTAVEPKFAFPSDLRILSDLAEALGGSLGVQPLAGPVFERLAAEVPAYKGAQAGLRAHWGAGR
jgi:predicted molibdopterin-dependent oxidoreductase YjgC